LTYDKSGNILPQIISADGAMFLSFSAMPMADRERSEPNFFGAFFRAPLFIRKGQMP